MALPFALCNKEDVLLGIEGLLRRASILFLWTVKSICILFFLFFFTGYVYNMVVMTGVPLG